MSLTRQTQKVFASNANADQLAVFGSMKTGTPQYSSNLATLQSTAYTEGWSEALLNDKAPYMEEMNAVQYGLSYQIAYMLQEGAFAYDANTNYSATSIVKAFENGKMYFYHSLSDNNLGHALSNTTYWEKINISDTRNIGEVVTSLLPLTDAGLHLLDGTLLSGSGSYSAFVDYIADLYIASPTANYFTTEANWQTSVSTYGVCGKFVYDSVNNTVRLPKVTGFVEGTIDANALGNLVQAGLPNITGTIPGENTNQTQYWENVIGAFYQTNTSNKRGNQNHDTDNTNIGFDASRSNSIYGNSNTVQPQAIKGFMYIVVATSIKTNIEVDIDEIATDLNGKADVDLANVNNSGRVLMSSVGMPSPTKNIQLTLGSSGTEYIAPANGWVLLEGEASANFQHVTVNATNGVKSASSVANGQLAKATIPVLKGQTYSIWYTVTADVRLYFYYAVGAESEAS